VLAGSKYEREDEKDMSECRGRAEESIEVCASVVALESICEEEDAEEL
jgi:hypothetical protein